MKKNIFGIALVLSALFLTGCTSAPNITRSAGASAADLPSEAKLALGTLNLEDTDYAITSEQAKELLPMFYVLQELNDSSASVQEETDGLISQIQETLTKDQIQAIDDMSLSMQDVLAITQTSSTKSGPTDASSASSASGGGAGGLPPDAGMMPGDMAAGSATTSTKSNSSAAPVMQIGTPSTLFDAVIELLQKKIEA